MSIRRRLAGAVGANGYGYAIIFIIQVGTVPILLGAWGPALYGEWLMVSAIPSYLAMSDFGLGTVLVNEMAICTGRGDRRAAITSFQSVSVTVLGLGLFGLLPLALALAHMPLEKLLGLELLGGPGLSGFIALLIAQVWLSQMQTLLQAGLICDGYYALGVVLANTIRLAEFLSLAVAATMGASPIMVVAWMVIVRIVGTVAVAAILNRRVPWLRFGFGEARLNVVGRMTRQGVLFLTFPIANSLNLQTPLLIIGTTLGAEATALFSTTRTLTRAVQQLMGIINASVWPEISRAFGQNDNGLLVILNRNAIKISFWLGVAGVGVVILAGPLVFTLWTHRTVSLDRDLLYLLSFVMLINAVWYTASVVLAATNRHAGFAMSYFLVNLAVPFLCLLLIRVDGLNGVALGLLFGEVVIATYVVPASVRSVNDLMVGLFRYVINPLVIY